MSNVMIDLETLGTGPNSVILSIGAVVFDEHKITDTLRYHIDPANCVAYGLEMDVSTVMWWLKQSDEARAGITDRQTVELPKALNAFAELVGPQTLVWGNGASFDNVILANAYSKIGRAVPWMFWNDRCYRTLKNLYPQIKPGEFKGVKHDALADATHQAAHTIKILQHIKDKA